MPILQQLMQLDASIADVVRSEAPVPAHAAGKAPVAQPPAPAPVDDGFDLQELQRHLQNVPLYREEIDGIHGPHTRDVIKALLITRQSSDWFGRPADRLLLAGKQALCDLDGVKVGDIDGIVGPQTQYAFSVHAARRRGDKTVETWRGRGGEEAADRAAIAKRTELAETKRDFHVLRRNGQEPGEARFSLFDASGLGHGYGC